MQHRRLGAAKDAKEFVSFPITTAEAEAIEAVQSVTRSNNMLVKVGERQDTLTLVESGMRRKHIMLAAGSGIAGLLLGIIVGRVTKQ